LCVVGGGASEGEYLIGHIAGHQRSKWGVCHGKTKALRARAAEKSSHGPKCPSGNNMSKINTLFRLPTLTSGTGAEILPHFSSSGMRGSLSGKRLKLRPLLSDGH